MSPPYVLELTDVPEGKGGGYDEVGQKALQRSQVAS